MAKRYTIKDDRFIHAYYDAVGDMIGPHDLNRPERSVRLRVEFLKSSGAWAALDREQKAHEDYLKAVGRYTETPE